MNLEEYQMLQPHAENSGITFFTPNTHCAWRVSSLLTKEKDTIDWIEHMAPGEMLFDVGANMGQYSLYAWKRGIDVHAFEPESQNFALLQRNIVVNKAETVTAWPLALADKPSIAIMHLSTVMPGGSCHAYEKPIGYNGKWKTWAATQGSVATTIDIFAAQFGMPDHIKIDVDGFEHLVLAGAQTTLDTVKSVLVELNTALPEHSESLFAMMADKGFTYDPAQQQSSMRKEGPFTGVGNVIFYRK